MCQSSVAPKPKSALPIFNDDFGVVPCEAVIRRVLRECTLFISHDTLFDSEPVRAFAVFAHAPDRTGHLLKERLSPWSIDKLAVGKNPNTVDPQLAFMVLVQ